ncbi:MAG TPA: hypothetical protein VGB26_05230 [Nitrospiria bacterium]
MLYSFYSWAYLGSFIREILLSEGTIDPEDVHLIYQTDQPSSAVKHI